MSSSVVHLFDGARSRIIVIVIVLGVGLIQVDTMVKVDQWYNPVGQFPNEYMYELCPQDNPCEPSYLCDFYECDGDEMNDFPKKSETCDDDEEEEYLESTDEEDCDKNIVTTTTTELPSSTTTMENDFTEQTIETNSTTESNSSCEKDDKKNGVYVRLYCKLMKLKGSSKRCEKKRCKFRTTSTTTTTPVSVSNSTVTLDSSTTTETTTTTQTTSTVIPETSTTTSTTLSQEISTTTSTTATPESSTTTSTMLETSTTTSAMPSTETSTETSTQTWSTTPCVPPSMDQSSMPLRPASARQLIRFIHSGRAPEEVYRFLESHLTPLARVDRKLASSGTKRELAVPPFGDTVTRRKYQLLKDLECQRRPWLRRCKIAARDELQNTL